MKKFFAYFFGGLACVGVGAGAYIALADNYRPSAAPYFFSQKPTASQSIDDLLPLVADKFGNKNPNAVPGQSGNEPDAAPGLLLEKEGGGVLFMGDMMLGRNVAVQIAKNGSDYPLAKIKDAVSSADYAIANMEGPITKINNAPSNNMRFHFDPSLVPVLAAAGFDGFSLANNHGLDQGAKGERETESSLREAGLGYFGAVDSDNGPVLHFSSGGKNVSVIGLHDVYRRIDPKSVAETIAAEKAVSDIVIVYPHWGDEYKHEHNARQSALAHAFIDAGADLVIGSHPHVVEGVETYKGRLIFYSLGNLVFDQYFSDDTQNGLALRLNIGSGGLDSVELLPYSIPLSQPAFVEGEAENKALSDLASWSDASLKAQIEAGKILLR
jgi:hypothetical protein